jgi:hypothetical protein
MALLPLPLPEGITSRNIQTNDLNIHILEAGQTPHNICRKGMKYLNNITYQATLVMPVNPIIR